MQAADAHVDVHGRAYTRAQLQHRIAEVILGEPGVADIVVQEAQVLVGDDLAVGIGKTSLVTRPAVPNMAPHFGVTRCCPWRARTGLLT